MAYIEQDTLMRRIKEIHCAECDSYNGVRCRACWVDDALNYIDSEPAADVVEAVRCKDCKWHDSVDGPMRQCDITDDDDFCSYGEREDKQSETD